jgi:hypothetical protein
MTAALVLYSAVFMRYSMAVTPKNYLLFGCHFVNECAQLAQGYRYINYWKYVSPFHSFHTSFSRYRSDRLEALEVTKNRSRRRPNKLLHHRLLVRPRSRRNNRGVRSRSRYHPQGCKAILPGKGEKECCGGGVFFRSPCFPGLGGRAIS